MGFLQAILGGVFTILGAGSMFFIAYKALTIGSDVAEMKELLRELQRGARGGTGTSPTVTASVGNFSAAMDSYETPTPPVKPVREFVLPPPISRRLDAERGIHRD